MSGPIAILSSMDQEISTVQGLLRNPQVRELHGQRFIRGDLAGIEFVTGTTGYGKVAAAATAAIVLNAFDAESIVFGGVAGGIRPDVQIGDIVVADRLIQHDYDASPIFERYLIPTLGIAEIPADPSFTDRLMLAASRYLATRYRQDVAGAAIDLLDIGDVQLHKGLIASGDQFIDNLAQARTLQGQLPAVLAVEMEGAAVAQVCAERQVPFCVFRLVSDRSDEDAEIDFIRFVSSVAAPVIAGIIEELTIELS